MCSFWSWICRLLSDISRDVLYCFYTVQRERHNLRNISRFCLQSASRSYANAYVNLPMSDEQRCPRRTWTRDLWVWYPTNSAIIPPCHPHPVNIGLAGEISWVKDQLSHTTKHLVRYTFDGSSTRPIRAELLQLKKKNIQRQNLRPSDTHAWPA